MNFDKRSVDELFRSLDPAGKHRENEAAAQQRSAILRRVLDAPPAMDEEPPRPRPTRRLIVVTAPLAVAGLATGVAVAVRGNDSDDSSTASERQEAMELLHRVALAAESTPPLKIRDNQYTYVESTVAWRQHPDWPSRSGGMMTDRGRTTWEYSMQRPHRRQVWMSVAESSGWIEEDDKPGVTKDEAPIRTNRMLLPPPSPDAAYRLLESYPADPQALLKKIDPSGSTSRFESISEILREAVLPPRFAGNLYRAVATLPGLSVIDDAVDAAGRPGVAVAHVDDDLSTRIELIFNKRTLAYQGNRVTQAEPAYGIPAGALISTTAILATGVADKPSKVPEKG